MLSQVLFEGITSGLDDNASQLFLHDEDITQGIHQQISQQNHTVSIECLLLQANNMLLHDMLQVQSF